MFKIPKGKDGQKNYVAEKDIITDTGNGAIKNEKSEKEISVDCNVEIKPMAKSVCKEFIMPPPNFAIPKKINVESNNSNSKHLDNVNKKKDKTRDGEQLSSNNKVKEKETEQQQFYPNLLYKEPRWSGVPSDRFYFEVIKDGCIKNVIELSGKAYHVFGRLEHCDNIMEHPSISRYHAVIQYRSVNDDENEKGVYLYDFGSTHGTYINNAWIHPKIYYRLRVGYMVKFGGSTRLHILQGPDYDQEQESERIVREELKPDDGKKNEKQNHKREKEEEGITWGMADDAIEEEIDLHNNRFGKPLLELKDPKKTLRAFFDKEGLNYDYEMDERGMGHVKVYIARIRLPVEDIHGDSLYAEGTASKKKDALLACSMEACKILDAHDLLRNVQHESEREKRAKELEENDYYDSDDDSYMDRTGSVEKKRLQRMKRAGKKKEETETYASLKMKLENIVKELEVEENVLDKALQAEKEDADDADMYMQNMDKRMDKKAKLKIKKKIAELDQEKKRLEKLIEIVKPVVPEIKWTTKVKDNQEHIKSPQNSNNDKKDEKEENQIDSVHACSTSPASHACSTSPASFKLPGLPSTTLNNEQEPNTSNLSKRNANDIAQEQLKKKKKKVYGAPQLEQNDPNVCEWTPPQGQSGDGKTHLNEKFGY